MTSRLIGTGGEELILNINPPDISPTEPDFVMWGFSAIVRLPTCVPPLNQRVHSCFYYALPDIESLRKLVDGDSSARFILNEPNFDLEIFEHTLNAGPRFGFIVVGSAYSNSAIPTNQWPSSVANHLLLDDSKGAVSVNFAFTVDQESLISFHHDLTVDLRRCSQIGE